MRVMWSSFVLLALFVVVAGAQTAGPATADDYMLGPEDVIEITVMNHPDLNKTITVPPDGTFSYAWATAVRASGKTTAQLASELQRVVDARRNNAEVSEIGRAHV